MESTATKNYKMIYIVPFKNLTPESAAIQMLREQGVNSGKVIDYMFREFAKKFGFTSVIPLDFNRKIDVERLKKEFPNGFEAVKVDVDLKNSTLLKQVFGDWQDVTVSEIEVWLKEIERIKKIERAAYHIKSIIEDTADEMVKNKTYNISDKNYRHAELSICLSHLLEKSEREYFFTVVSEIVPKLEQYFKYEDSELVFSNAVKNYKPEDSSYLPKINCQLNIVLNSPRVEDQLTVFDIGKRPYENYMTDIREYLDKMIE